MDDPNNRVEGANNLPAMTTNNEIAHAINAQGDIQQPSTFVGEDGVPVQIAGNRDQREDLNPGIMPMTTNLN